MKIIISIKYIFDKNQFFTLSSGCHVGDEGPVLCEIYNRCLNKTPIVIYSV